MTIHDDPALQPAATETLPYPKVNSTAQTEASPRQSRRLTLLREQAHWLILIGCGLLLLPLCYEIGWLRSWYRSDSPEAYQPLIPLGALALAWSRRKQIVVAANHVSRAMNSGEPTTTREHPGSILMVALSSLLLLFNHLLRYQEVSVVAIVLFVAGAALYLYGPIMLRVLRPPLLFLFLMAPLPNLIVSHFSQMMQLNSTLVSGELLLLMHVPVKIEGNTLILPHYRLEVTTACGGIGTVLALQILTIWLLAMHRPNRFQCFTLFTFVSMLAVVTNILRIVTMGLIALKLPRLAGSLHDANSWLFTFLLFGLTYWISLRLRILPRWTSSKLNLSSASSDKGSIGSRSS